MTDKEFQKRYEYSFVRVDEKDDLRWVKAIVARMYSNGKITTQETNNLVDSLVMVQ